MLYDRESGKIKITLSEFVGIARRGISPALPYDEDEPRSESISSRRLGAIIGKHEPKALYYEFSADEYCFEMVVRSENIRDNTLTIARSVEASPKKPSKDETAQIRAEAFIMGHVLASIEKFSEIKLTIVYINSSSGEHNISTETVHTKKLAAFFHKCISMVKKYARPEIERVTERLPTLAKMKFPYSSIRDGQSEFIKRAYRSISRGGVLYASAPTGTGKTVSALFPALRALGDGRIQKIFYLTPKYTTAEALRDCTELMCSQGAKIRAVILRAKDKLCISGHACRRSRKLCPYSRCNNIADATIALYNENVSFVTPEKAIEVSQKQGVCPYELMLAYSELCDIVCCDFNHVFDPRAHIRRFFDAGGNYALLVDEAHNLVERAREMYSDEILDTDIGALGKSELLGEHHPLRLQSENAKAVFRDIIMPYLNDELREGEDGVLVGAANTTSIPDRLYTLIDELTRSSELELYRSFCAKDAEAEERTRLIRGYYYKIKRFGDALARFDNGYQMFMFYENGAVRIKIFCLDASAELRRVINLCHSALMFSATLSPLDYYKAVLGGERSDQTLEVGSPFDSSQLSVTIMDKVSTRYSEREDTLAAVCRVIAATVSAKRGHYMIFSPSFAYSDALTKAFTKYYPKIKIISQKRDMSESDKTAFLESFKNEDGKYLIAFCVMGGIYSEGIDLAGDSLIGAVVVGIGIPSLSYEREALTAYYNDKYDMGKQYAYIYPGMNRVFQAAGRVIRSEDDRGVIVLVDDRFDDPIYKKSLPALWRGVKFIGEPKRLREVLDEFWAEGEK